MNGALVRLSNIPRCVALIGLSAFMPGCVTHLINKNFPPVDTVAKRREAIANSEKALAALVRVDAHANVAAADFKTAVQAVLADAHVGVTAVDISFAQQELIADVDFDRSFSETINGTVVEIRLTGEATLHSTGYIDQAKVKWTSWGSRVRLKKLQVKGHSPANKILVEVVTAILNTYLLNISGLIGTQTIAIDTPVFQTIKPSDVIHGDAVLQVEGDPISFKVRLVDAAALLDEQGVHLLAKLSENEALLQPSALAVTALAAPSDPLDRDFARYRGAFQARVASSFGVETSGAWPQTSAFITRAYAAGLINDTFAGKTVRARLGLDYIKQEFGGLEIRATGTNVNCQVQADATDCNPTRDCNLNKSCEPGWPCPDCEWYQVDCHARRAGCEIDKGRFKAQCEAEKVAFRTGCEAEKALERGVCEVKKAATLAGCQANQKWLDMWQGAHFANIYGNAEFGKIEAQVGAGNMTVGADLSQPSVSLEISAHSDVVVTFDIRPVDAGHLFCPLPFGGQVRFGVDVTPQAFALQGTLDRYEVAADRALILQMSTPPTKITFHATQPPVLALLAQNPHFVLSCAPVAAVAGALGLQYVQLTGQLPPDLIQQDFARELPAQRFDLRAPSTFVEVGQKRFELWPSLTPQSFGYRATTSTR